MRLCFARSIAVRAPARIGNCTITETVCNIAYFQLAALSKQADPKALLQYMIAVNLQLNALSDSEDSSADDELLRESVSALASLS